ncbi:MAG: ABC transporter ATP-binding protein [Clostridiales bacterium]|nr:ABC transporter ATP-binding protein [Clostridiales bacterium]
MRIFFLTVGESSIYGLVGYNGAGKTALLKICAGIYKTDGGAVYIGGENVYDNGVLRADMLYIPDDLYFLPGANLLKMKKFYKGYFPNFSDSVFDNMVDAMGLNAKKNIASFSKRIQRQAQIALAMATKPKYVLLDEVFDGIDPQKGSLCKNIFLEYMAKTGCSMILSSHNLGELSDLCDHIALINGRKLALNVSVDDVSTAYKKYRMIFAENAQKSLFDGIENKGITIDGRTASIIVSTNFDSTRLNELRPIHIDSVNLSVEEIFLNEMEDKKYDIAKIFSE